MIQSFLLRKSRDVDCLKTRERLASVFDIVSNCLVRKIAQPVVITIVANLRGQFRRSSQCVFPLVGEQTSEFGASRFERLLRRLSRSLSNERNNETEDKRNRNNDE